MKIVFSVHSPQSAVCSSSADCDGVFGTRDSGLKRGFTMIEIALCLAIIGFALVAIIAVLPTGLNVQRDNREETIINQDAIVWMNAIRNGAQGLDDLTNYVTGITNYWTTYEVTANAAKTNLLEQGQDGYSLAGSKVTSVTTVPDNGMTITNGRRIIGLLATPKYVPDPPLPGSGGVFRSNYIVAYVRAFSGAGVEKPPQQNETVLNAAFNYRMIVENCSYVPVQPEFKTNFASSNLFSVLQTNSHDLRLLFRWPILPNGETGNGRQTFRLFTGGVVSADKDYFFPDQQLFFFQPSTYVQPRL